MHHIFTLTNSKAEFLQVAVSWGNLSSLVSQTNHVLLRIAGLAGNRFEHMHLEDNG